MPASLRFHHGIRHVPQAHAGVAVSQQQSERVVQPAPPSTSRPEHGPIVPLSRTTTTTTSTSTSTSASGTMSSASSLSSNLPPYSLVDPLPAVMAARLATRTVGAPGTARRHEAMPALANQRRVDDRLQGSLETVSRSLAASLYHFQQCLQQLQRRGDLGPPQAWHFVAFANRVTALLDTPPAHRHSYTGIDPAHRLHILTAISHLNDIVQRFGNDILDNVDLPRYEELDLGIARATSETAYQQTDTRLQRVGEQSLRAVDAIVRRLETQVAPASLRKTIVLTLIAVMTMVVGAACFIAMALVPRDFMGSLPALIGGICLVVGGIALSGQCYKIRRLRQEDSLYAPLHALLTDMRVELTRVLAAIAPQTAI